MKYPVRIALRYIFSPHSFNFINIITILSILGITVGVAALICVMSIFNGFGKLTESQIISFDPHIRLKPRQGAWINNSDRIMKQLGKIEGISGIIPIIQGKAVAMHGSNLQAFNLVTIPADISASSFPIKNKMIYGSFNISDTNDIPGFVAGIVFADRQRLLPGDSLRLLSPQLIESALTGLSAGSGIPVRLQGIFSTSNIKDYDVSLGVSSSELGRRLFKAPPKALSFIDIRLGSLASLDKIKAEISAAVPGEIEILTWEDLNKDLLLVMKLERLGTFIVLSLIIIIAAFNLLASLSMTVVEKIKDIALLKALGARDKAVSRIFLYEGMLVGAISVALGTSAGLLLCLGQEKYGWITIDVNKYIVSSLPVSADFADVFFVVIVSLLLSFLATIYPSRRASTIVISEALRGE